MTKRMPQTVFKLDTAIKSYRQIKKCYSQSFNRGNRTHWISALENIQICLCAVGVDLLDFCEAISTNIQQDIWGDCF
jgi:hypothetical protein